MKMKINKANIKVAPLEREREREIKRDDDKSY
jgi:hypothetical protein